MIISIYIVLFILMIASFVTAFFVKQEVIWAISLVLSGLLMYASYGVEYFTYVFNSTLGAYQPSMVSFSYPYLMGVNMLFFSLGLILCIIDLFDKYRDHTDG